MNSIKTTTKANHIRKKYDEFASLLDKLEKSRGLNTECLGKLNCYSLEYTFRLPPVILCGKLYLGSITCLLPIP